MDLNLELLVRMSLRHKYKEIHLFMTLVECLSYI